MGQEKTFNGVPFIVGVSGHRKIGNDVTVRGEVRKQLESIFSQANTSTEMVLLTGLAEGADQLAAEVALELNWCVVAVLPMARADYLVDFQTEASKSRFSNLLAQCQYTIELPRNSASLDLDRVRQYCALGEFLTGHSQLMLLLWDGDTTSVEPGGTAWVREQCLSGLPNATSPLDRNQTCYIHIPVVRQSGNALPDIDHPPVTEGTSYLQWEVDLKYISEFNADCVESESVLMLKRLQSKDHLLDEGTLNNIVEIPNRCIHLYAHSDAISTTDQVRRRKIIRLELALISMSAVAVSIYSGPHMALVWLALHLAFFSAFVFLYFRHFNPTQGHPSRLQKWLSWENLDTRYLDYRAFAEGLRVQLFWRLQGLRDCVADYYLCRRHQETRWISAAVRNVTLMDDLSTLAKNDKSSPVLHHSDIVGKKWIEEQSKYYLGTDLEKSSGKYLFHLQLHNKLDKLSLQVFGVAILSIIANFIYHIIEHGNWFDPISSELPLNGYITWMNFLISVLIIFAGTIKAYDSLMGNEERANNYKFYGDLFRSAVRSFVFAAGDKVSKTNNDMIVYELGRAALAESADWLIKHRKQSLNVKDQL